MSDGLEIAILDEVEGISKKLDEGGGESIPVLVGSIAGIATDDILYTDISTGYLWLRSGYVETDPSIYPSAPSLPFGIAEYDSQLTETYKPNMLFTGFCWDDEGNAYTVKSSDGMIYKAENWAGGAALWVAWQSAGAYANRYWFLTFDGVNICASDHYTGTATRTSKGGVKQSNVAVGGRFGLASSQTHYFALDGNPPLQKLYKTPISGGSAEVVDIVLPIAIGSSSYLSYLTGLNSLLVIQNADAFLIDVDTGGVSAYPIDLSSNVAGTTKGLTSDNDFIYSFAYASNRTYMYKYRLQRKGSGAAGMSVDARSGLTNYMLVSKGE